MAFARCRHDNQAINTMIEREAVAAGKRPLKKDRFVKITDPGPVVDWALVERAAPELVGQLRERGLRFARAAG